MAAATAARASVTVLPAPISAPAASSATLPVHHETVTVGGQDVFVMGAAAVFGHFGRRHR